MHRPDAEALDSSDRLALVEARLDLINERLADHNPPQMTAAEARLLHQRDLVAAFTVAFVAVVAALTALGYWAIGALR